MIFFVDETFSGLGNGNNAIGEHEAFVFDFVDERVAGMHAGAVKLGGVDVSDERCTVLFFGKNAGFVG